MPTTTTPQDIEAMIFKELEKFGAEPDALTRDATFEDLDIDSLDLVELTQSLEDEFGIKLDGDDFKDVKSVGDTVDLVHERVPG